MLYSGWEHCSYAHFEPGTPDTRENTTSRAPFSLNGPHTRRAPALLPSLLLSLPRPLQLGGRVAPAHWHLLVPIARLEHGPNKRLSLSKLGILRPPGMGARVTETLAQGYGRVQVERAHWMRTAPHGSGSLAFGVFLVVLPSATSTTCPVHQMKTCMRLRLSPSGGFAQ